MRVCNEYDNKTGVCAQSDKTGVCAQSDKPCPHKGDRDECTDWEKAGYSTESEWKTMKMHGLEKPEEDLNETVGRIAREAVESTGEEDPTMEILTRVLDLIGQDPPLKDAVIRLIDAQTKRILAEASWRNALALKHHKSQD